MAIRSKLRTIQHHLEDAFNGLTEIRDMAWEVDTELEENLNQFIERAQGELDNAARKAKRMKENLDD